MMRRELEHSIGAAVLALQECRQHLLTAYQIATGDEGMDQDLNDAIRLAGQALAKIDRYHQPAGGDIEEIEEEIEETDLAGLSRWVESGDTSTER